MSKKNIFIAIIIFWAISLSSCNTAPEKINLGIDNCYFCKMTISDAKFGAEIVTQKGKLFKFDDVHCILSYLKAQSLQPKQVKEIYLTDFCSHHQLINVKHIFLLKSPELRSPMDGNIAAFDNADSLKIKQQHYGGDIINWNELSKQ